jgi:uncharacterized protein (DUF1697 family)
MSIYIALLRGINVSGYNKIKMADLKDSLSSLDIKNIQTYLQSGNVIFESSISTISELERQIKVKILKDFRYEIPVLVLTKESLNKVFKNNPLLDDTSLDIKKIYTVFLAKTPVKEMFREIQSNPDFPESMVLKNRIIYLYYTNGYGRSKVNNNFFERKLKVAATTRNWNTISKLHELVENI